MSWIYLSPHLDDVAFSCGGLLWEQAHTGIDVQVWTVCAGDPPAGPISSFAQSLHARWEGGADAGQLRRQEDRLACGILGGSARHFPIPDCIYRRHPDTGDYLYDSEQALFSPLHPSEDVLVQSLARTLLEVLPGGPAQGVNLVLPLSLGGHVDHRLTRAAAQLIHCSELACTAWYYADFPYVLEDSTLLAELPKEGWHSQVFPISEAGLSAWQRSMAAYRSQVSTFWDGIIEMEASIRAYCMETGGVRLWQKAERV